MSSISVPSLFSSSARSYVMNFLAGYYKHALPCHAERREESLTIGASRKGLRILRGAQNDRSSLVSHSSPVVQGYESAPHASKNSTRSEALRSYSPRQNVVCVSGLVSRTPRISTHR